MYQQLVKMLSSTLLIVAQNLHPCLDWEEVQEKMNHLHIQPQNSQKLKVAAKYTVSFHSIMEGRPSARADLQEALIYKQLLFALIIFSIIFIMLSTSRDALIFFGLCNRICPP